jgi:hypothetical protein
MNKLTYKIVINWKHNSPSLEFRYLDKEEVEKFYRKLCNALNNNTYIELELRGNKYMIDLAGIAYIEYNHDLPVNGD